MRNELKSQGPTQKIGITVNYLEIDLYFLWVHVNLFCSPTDVICVREGGASPYVDDVFSPTETSSDLSSYVSTTPEPIPSHQVNERVRMRWKRGLHLHTSSP